MTLSSTADPLDAEELLQLAVRSSGLNKHEESIAYLKRAISVDPTNAKAYHMLGAEHAQIGLYDRAVSEMQRAVELDPALSTAHFQLGLLHITAGRIDQAQDAWRPIEKLDSKDPLRLFVSALLHLASNQFDAAKDELQRGIALNRTNGALNQDMQRILAELEKLGDGADKSATGNVSDGAAAGNYDAMLSAYKQNRHDDAD